MRSTANDVITTDEPVLALGGPGTHRAAHGQLEKSPVLTYPLAPDAILVMTKTKLGRIVGPPVLLEREVDELNYELLLNTYRWAFECPGNSYLLQKPIPPRPDVIVHDNTTLRPSRHIHSREELAWPFERLWTALADGGWTRPGASFFRS